LYSENAKSLNDKADSDAIYSNIDTDLRNSAEADQNQARIGEVLGFKRNCAEARKPRKQGLSPEEADAYLSEVDASLSDATTRAAAKCECPMLSNIVDDDALPERVRTRAARLRDVARDAA
jgi:hypothetical protein